jgi:hypothetical protein
MPAHRSPLRVVQRDPSDWTSELTRELVARIDLGEAPLAQATLIHQPDRSTLILAMHHAIADAKSVVFAIRDMLVVLSGRQIDSLPPIRSLTEFLCGGRMERQFDRSEESPPPPTNAKADIYRSFDREMPRIARLTLAPRLTVELQNRCRREGVTVHHALVSAAIMAARAISAQLRDSPIMVISPSDMRALLGAGEDVAPLAGGASLIIEASRQPASVWQVARMIKAGLVPPRTMSRQPSLPEAMAFLASSGGHKLSINNLGRIPFQPAFGTITLEALWGPAILLGYEGERLISAATVNGSLDLLHTSYDPIPSILDVMQQRLTAACAL